MVSGALLLPGGHSFAEGEEKPLKGAPLVRSLKGDMPTLEGSEEKEEERAEGP